MTVCFATAQSSQGISDRSMEVMTRNMTQLVRITGDVDCNDLVVLDLQRGGLQRIVLLDGDEAWQAVDEAVAHEPRHVPGKDRRQCRMDLHDVIEPDGRLQSSERPPASLTSVRAIGSTAEQAGADVAGTRDAAHRR